MIIHEGKVLPGDGEGLYTIEEYPDPAPTPEERIQRLEETKAEQTDVDELHEALEMILTGVVE